MSMADQPCANDNPYSPKCRGAACTHIKVLPGQEGEFYVSRADNSGNKANEGQRNYTDNEWAMVMFPRSGRITVAKMDVEAGDTLQAVSSDGLQSFPGDGLEYGPSGIHFTDMVASTATFAQHIM